MVCPTVPYKMSIPVPESFDSIEQRVQIETPDTIWDVCWDSQKNHVICYDSSQNFYQICLDNQDSDQITMYAVMTALGYPHSESDYYIYPGYLDIGINEEELLGFPISSTILFQMGVTSSVQIQPN